MATTAKTVETELQRRLRIGTAEKAISDANLFSIINYAQRTLNYTLQVLSDTATFKCASSTTVLHYTTTSIAADCHKVLELSENTTTAKLPLRQINWQEFKQYDRDWINTTGTRSEAWAPIGDNMMAVYPASTLTYHVVYLKESTTLNSSGDALIVPDMHMDLIYELCEIVGLAHLRLYPEVKRKIEQFRQSIAPHIGGE